MNDAACSVFQDLINLSVRMMPIFLCLEPKQKNRETIAACSVYLWLREKSTEEIIQLYSGAIKELKRREVIRTNNVVGELGEYLAITHYNNTPGLPNLSPAPVCTENIDAISRKGDRYSIKSTSNTTTGVFYGLEPEGSSIPDKQKFEYVIICKFDDDYELETILELDWDTFLKNKHWHKRMTAWNLSLTRKLREQCKVIYERPAGQCE